MITLGLLARRYTHDAWEPPNSRWVLTRGEVVKHTKVAYSEEYAQPGSLSLSGIVRVEYSFQTKRGGEHTAHYDVGEYEAEKMPVGRTFDVYYQPENPSWHEFQDFRPDPDDVMPSLFDATRVHTPE